MILDGIEFSASEVRKVLQQLFPHRRLVLSQFTFFNQIGIARPSGETFRRGRRCYRVEDILPIACVLALKEEGIPFKNIEALPEMVHNAASKILSTGPGCRLSGMGEKINLTLPGVENQAAITSLEDLLNSTSGKIFWSFDIGILATQLQAVVEIYLQEETRRAA